MSDDREPPSGSSRDGTEPLFPPVAGADAPVDRADEQLDRPDALRPGADAGQAARPAGDPDPSGGDRGGLDPVADRGPEDTSGEQVETGEQADQVERRGRHEDSPPTGVGSAAASATSDGHDPSREPRARRSRSSGRAASSGGSFLRELPVLLLIAFVLAFVLRTFVIQVFFIPSGSMEPTLQVDDRMVVEKVTYRFTDIDRGDVAVFEGESFGQIDPDASAGERFVRGVGQFLGLVPASARDFVKRVIGLPGDEILIEDGTVFVNGEPLDEPYVVFEDPSDFGPVTVPDGQLFFLGDNRPNSSDSRRSLGYVPIDNVVGRAAFIIWPPDNVGSLMGTTYDLPQDIEVSDDAAQGVER